MLYSGHAPILAILEPKTRIPKKPFRFENWWLLERDFQQVAQSSWIKSNQRNFHARTRVMAKDLKIWSKKKKPIHEQLSQIEETLLQHQSKIPALRDYQLETSLATQHYLLLTKNAEYHKQRAKQLWATQGDRNTEFFHKAIMKRARRNKITSIIDTNGNVHSDPQAVATVLISYFSNLFATQLQASNSEHAPSQRQAIIDDYTYSSPDLHELHNLLKGISLKV